MIRLRTLPILALLFVTAPTSGRPSDSPDLEQKIAAVLPTPQEDAFLKIPWRLNLLTARSEAARTGKPLFIWSMNGHPLGHT